MIGWIASIFRLLRHAIRPEKPKYVSRTHQEVVDCNHGYNYPTQ